MHTKSQSIQLSFGPPPTSICSPKVNYFSVDSLPKVLLLVKENKLSQAIKTIILFSF